MKTIISGVAVALLVGLIVSCASPPTVTKPYRPSSGIPNANVVGPVQVIFNSPNDSHWSRVQQHNEEAYVSLLETARQEYDGNIDVVDIAWAYLQRDRQTKLHRYSASGKVVLYEGGGTTARRNTAPGIEGALERAADQSLMNVPPRSRIAIVFITAEDRNTTDYIAGELEFMWVNSGYIITDRSELDRLRREQNFQLSGEVDDETAVSIGRFAGADIIVTGRVDGEGSLRRLRLRVINTQTAQVVGVASEPL